MERGGSSCSEQRTEALEKEDAIKMFDINVITPLIAPVPVIK